MRGRQQGANRRSWELGIVAMMSAVLLMSLAIYLDMAVLTQYSGVRVGHLVFSYAIFPEFAFIPIIIFFARKNADMRLIWISCLLYGLFTAAGFVIFYG